jgi:hypothetical protein
MKLSKPLSIQQAKKNFKEMSLLLKIMLVMSVYAFGASIYDFVMQKSVNFSYFGTNFPQDFPLIWHVQSIIIGAISIYIFVRRSRSLLIKYTIFSAIFLLVGFLNSIYSVEGLLAQSEELATTFTPTFYYFAYAALYLVVSFFLVYPLTQKKYFDQK